VNLQRLSKNTESIYNLLRIREILPTAIIAGGWLRDLYHNIPFSDVDVYVTEIDAVKTKHSIYDKEFWVEQFQLRTDGFMSYDSIHRPGEGNGYEGKSHINTVWEIRKGFTNYNIIILDMNPTDYVNQYFDIGLCKAYCDGSRIRLTADFMHDSQYKRLTLVSKEIEEDEFLHVMSHHVPKIRNKYPGYTLIVPEMYQDWYQEFTANNS